MLKAFVEKIAAMALPQPIELESRPYTTAPVFPVKTPLPDEMLVHTLTGIKDYLNDNPDGLDLDHVLVQVLEPKIVRVKSTLKPPFEDRGAYLLARHDQPEFPFGKYLDIETFIIEMQAKFVQDDMTGRILQLVGNLTDGEVRTFADDGVTQQVAAKSGIGRVENVSVPNPVTLQPRRTFLEIEQPPGTFVMRLKSNGERPHVALFEADGGAWQLEAIKRIRDWFRQNENVPAEIVIIA